MGSTFPGADPVATAPTVLDYTMLMSPPSLADHLFGTERSGLRSAAARDVVGRPLAQIDEHARRALLQSDVLIMGWGAPSLTEADLDAAPHVKAILFAGGRAASLLPSTTRDRGILLSNAGHANAVPVAEFTTALILLANKRALQSARLYQRRREFIDREQDFLDAGNRGKTVGIIGASRIGRMVMERLNALGLELDVALYDPYVVAEDARALGVRLASLEEIMATSDVVSLHAPLTVDTAGMITGKLLRSLRDGATFINTARGLLVDQDALVDELRTGRIDAMLDVTTPEVLPPDHALYDLPNVLLTPHMAGSTGPELARLGEHVASELNRLAHGLPLAFPENG